MSDNENIHQNGHFFNLRSAQMKLYNYVSLFWPAFNQITKTQIKIFFIFNLIYIMLQVKIAQHRTNLDLQCCDEAIGCFCVILQLDGVPSSIREALGLTEPLDGGHRLGL